MYSYKLYYKNSKRSSLKSFIFLWLLGGQMNYTLHSFRYGLEILTTDTELSPLFSEILMALDNISDEEIINYFNTQTRRAKSISDALNYLIKEKLVNMGWEPESPIFNDDEYRLTRNSTNWRLDFAKDLISIEVAFNHGEAIAWNLIKPVLASELNHVEKAIQTKAGVVICATDNLKRSGGFDNAVGTYEKFLQYLKPLNNLLSVPMVIVGLESPESFYIEHTRVDRFTTGSVVYIEENEENE
jgi:hypothetical protein